MKEIGIIISQLSGFTTPSRKIEQYETDGETINFFLTKALRDIRDSMILDLGSGTGFLSFACALAGAKFVLGVEIDKNALIVSKYNLQKILEIGYEIRVSFICCDVENFYPKKKFDVCVMNPPFGIQKKFADRIFLKKAFETSDIIWTFLSKDSKPFVEAFANENEFEISQYFKTKIQLKKKFHFHKKKTEFIEVDLYRIQRKTRLSFEYK